MGQLGATEKFKTFLLLEIIGKHHEKYEDGRQTAGYREKTVNVLPQELQFGRFTSGRCERPV